MTEPVIHMPNINPEDRTIETPVQEVEEPKGSGIEPEPKDPNTKVAAMKAKTFRDGSIREWNWAGPLSEEKMWILGRKTLGLSDSEAGQYQNEIGDIMKLALEHLQSDDEFEVAKFLRKQLRFTPNSGNRIFNLLHNLIALRKEQYEQG